MTTILQERPATVRPATRSRLALALIALTIGLSCWFCYRMWSDIATLTTRTLPGIGYAYELLHQAAGLETLRLGGAGAGPAWRDESDSFLEMLARYEQTVSVDLDQLNTQQVRRSFARYHERPTDESWQQLRGDIRALYDFRHARSLMFANNSRESFVGALAVNAVGLVCFGILSIILSLRLALVRSPEPRPDDF